MGTRSRTHTCWLNGDPLCRLPHVGGVSVEIVTHDENHFHDTSFSVMKEHTYMKKVCFVVEVIYDDTSTIILILL